MLMGEPNTSCAIDLEGKPYTICNSTKPYTPGSEDQGKVVGMGGEGEFFINTPATFGLQEYCDEAIQQNVG